MRLRNEKKNENNKKEMELILKLKQNNHQAFEEIIFLYQKKIFKLAYCFFQDREDAMEIVQETFLRLFKKIDRFKEESHFQNWIYRIASNLCIDYYRRFKKKKIDEAEFFNFMKNQYLDTKGPEEHMTKEIEKKSIKYFIQLLPKRQKMVFTLKHFGYLKFKDISRILNISIGTVKSLHHRAIFQLKKRAINLREIYK